MICPSCSGKRQTLAHVNRAAPRKHSWEMLDCSTCEGSGEITEEHADRITEGERRREDRKARLMTLRRESERLGITARELSDIENGRLPKGDQGS